MKNLIGTAFIFSALFFSNPGLSGGSEGHGQGNYLKEMYILTTGKSHFEDVVTSPEKYDWSKVDKHIQSVFYRNLDELQIWAKYLQFKFNTDEEITSPAVCLQLSPTKEYQIDVKLNACKDELTSLGKAVSVISFSILNRINRSQAENYLLSKALGSIADPEMFEPY